MEMKYHNKKVDVEKYRTFNQINGLYQGIISFYVDLEGDQSINISAPTRHELMQLSSTSNINPMIKSVPRLMSIPTTPSDDDGKDDEILDELFDVIEKECKEDGEVEDDMETVEMEEDERRRVREYFEKFEIAIEEVVWLMKQDCLLRFYDSEEYKQI